MTNIKFNIENRELVCATQLCVLLQRILRIETPKTCMLPQRTYQSMNAKTDLGHGICTRDL